MYPSAGSYPEPYEAVLFSSRPDRTGNLDRCRGSVRDSVWRFNGTYVQLSGLGWADVVVQSKAGNDQEH